MYGERVGALHAFTESADEAQRFISNISILIRTTYYNHPKHGALIVDTICRNPELFESFLTELRGISNGTISMRTALRQELEALKTLGHWNHITD